MNQGSRNIVTVASVKSADTATTRFHFQAFVLLTHDNARHLSSTYVGMGACNNIIIVVYHVFSLQDIRDVISFLCTD